MSAGPLKLRPGVVTQVFNGEMVLLDVAAGLYYDLNASGTLMLEQLLAGSAREDIVATVQGRFEVDAARVAADLDALLATLRGAGLVED